MDHQPAGRVRVVERGDAAEREAGQHLKRVFLWRAILDARCDPQTGLTVTPAQPVLADQTAGCQRSGDGGHAVIRTRLLIDETEAARGSAIAHRASLCETAGVRIAPDMHLHQRFGVPRGEGMAKREPIRFRLASQRRAPLNPLSGAIHGAKIESRLPGRLVAAVSHEHVSAYELRKRAVYHVENLHAIIRRTITGPKVFFMSDSSGAIDRTEFGRLVREGLADLYDQAALQTSPLAALLLAETGERRPRPVTRAELLRQALTAAIEQLRPAEKTSGQDASEWRPYLLLTGRYVDGESLQDLQKRLVLSERQLRREHGRALEAVATLLWDQASHSGSAVSTEEKAGQEFALNLRPLNPLELLQGVALTLRHRAESEDVTLHLPSDQSPPRILADRIILRQILFSLLNLVFDLSEDGQVYVEIESSGPNMAIATAFRLENTALLTDDDAARGLAHAQLWARRCGGDLQHVLSDRQPGLITLRLTLPRGSSRSCSSWTTRKRRCSCTIATSAVQASA